MPEVEAEVGTEVGTKRSMDYDEYDDQVNKMVKSDTTEVRLLLLGRSCGGIIGKGGENITRLRSSYQVHLRMPSTQTVDRAITISGTTENCLGVVKEILTHSIQVPYSTNQQCSIEINLLVQTSMVGSILGKGGVRITEIRESTNAKIKVYEECLPNSNERVIAIGGDDEQQVLIALTTILNILKAEPTRSKPAYYDPSNKSNEFRMPSNKSNEFRMPITKSSERGGGGGANRSNVQKSTWGAEGGHSLMGGGYAVNAPVAGGIQPLMGKPITNANVVNNPMGNANANVNNPDNSPSFLQLQTVTSITAPNDMCGAIIGKGGSRIREIRDSSGAKINFSESEKDSKDDRIITITGTQQQVQQAEQLITRFMCN